MLTFAKKKERKTVKRKKLQSIFCSNKEREKYWIKNLKTKIVIKKQII